MNEEIEDILVFQHGPDGYYLCWHEKDQCKFRHIAGADSFPAERFHELQNLFVAHGWIMVVSHEEVIKCPECSKIQTAIVEHTAPFNTYVHECKGEECDYIITETDWEVVTE